MKQIKIIITMFALIALVACGTKSTDNKVVNSGYDERVDFIINRGLSLNDYSEIKKHFPEEGLVPNAKMAFQIAEVVLSQIYGAEKIASEKPFSINLENGVWMVEGYLEDGFLGGVAYIEIRKSNGEILKVIHTK
jgi:hypothetical protein